MNKENIWNQADSSAAGTYISRNNRLLIRRDFMLEEFIDLSNENTVFGTLDDHQRIHSIQEIKC